MIVENTIEEMIEEMIVEIGTDLFYTRRY
jgi:hypothetical protein